MVYGFQFVCLLTTFLARKIGNIHAKTVFRYFVYFCFNSVRKKRRHLKFPPITYVAYHFLDEVKLTTISGNC